MTVPIAPPGVQVQTKFVSATPTRREPELPPSCLIGPCYRVVDAFDTAGAVNTAARGGAYQNNVGKVAYAFPDFPADAVLDSDSVKVYVQSGSSADKLKGADDEIALAAGTGWAFTASTRILSLTGATVAGQLFAMGIVAGDVIRLTMAAVTSPPTTDAFVDLRVKITPIAGSTTLEMEEEDHWGYDLTGASAWTVIRDAAQFVVNSTIIESKLRVVDPADISEGLDFAASPTGPALGSLGDGIQVTFDGTKSAINVIITSVPTGFTVLVEYNDGTSTWDDIATAINTANTAFSATETLRPLATTVALTPASAVAAPASATLVALGDVDLNGVFLLDGGADADTVLLDADLLNVLYSLPKTSALSGYALIQYRALRVDVSAAAANPALLSFGNRTEMIASIGPIDTRNPLALMFEKAFDNAPTTRITGLGVSATSTAFADGTPASYSEAFDYISSQRIWCIACLSQASQVQQKLRSHIIAMRTAAEKSERSSFISRALPTNAADTVLFSGTANGEVTDVGSVGAAADGDTFASGDNLSTAAVGDVLVIDGLDGPFALGNGFTGWYVTVAAAGDVTVDSRVVAGTPDTAGPWPQVGEDLTWVLYRPGAAITSNADKAQAIATYSEGLAHRAMQHVHAPECAITVNGVQARLGGGYVCAALAGQVGQLKPSDPHSNVSIAGIDAIYGSNDTFSRSLLNLIAGGGTWVMAQEAAGGPVYTRHQLTTDVTTTEKSEYSILKVLDFLTYFYRDVLRPFSGKFNISGGYLDMINTQIEGHRAGLVGRALVADVKLLNLRQDDSSPTTVLINIGVDFLYPANYLDVTLEA